MTHLAAYIHHRKLKRENLEKSFLPEVEKQKLREKYYAKAKEQTQSATQTQS